MLFGSIFQMFTIECVLPCAFFSYGIILSPGNTVICYSSKQWENNNAMSTMLIRHLNSGKFNQISSVSVIYHHTSLSSYGKQFNFE